MGTVCDGTSNPADFHLPALRTTEASEKTALRASSPGVIECWLKPEDAGINRPFGDAAHCDFWRAAPTGRAVIMRGYQEDGQDTFAPRTIFDTTLPTWRLGEALLHAEALAIHVAEKPDDVKVRLRVLYTGLSGRVLRAWANPMTDIFMEGGAARSDEAMLETVVPVKEICNVDRNLHIAATLASLLAIAAGISSSCAAACSGSGLPDGQRHPASRADCDHEKKARLFSGVFERLTPPIPSSSGKNSLPL